MTDNPVPLTAPCPDCPHPWSEHEHGGLGNDIGDGCYHRVDRDPEPGDDKWCPCRRTPPVPALTAEKLRALALAGRKQTVSLSQSEEMWVALREEHKRMADRWAAEQGGAGGFVFFDAWEPLAGRDDLVDHARVIDLSEFPAGTLSPRSMPLTDTERRDLVRDMLRLIGAPTTDAEVDACLAIAPAPEAGS